MISVLIVDDSAVVRQVLMAQLQQASGIRLLGAARDPLYAMDMMRGEWPDVIILDLEMPRMDGLTFLRKLMAQRPTPVVICSTLTGQGAEATLQAMAAGAVDIITKPQAGLKGFLQESEQQLLQAVRAASRANMSRMLPPDTDQESRRSTATVAQSVAGGAMAQTTDRVVALGTSTGGTQALEQVLTRLPRTAPGLVIVQHMPAQFTAAFAARLNQLCPLQVKEAQSGDRVLPGLVLIAPGGRHMLLRRSGAQYRVEIKDGPLVSRHRPSVDVLFRSVANAAGANALGIIMTGMGDDGARGMKEMYQAGAVTVAQDEQSSVVYGMPKEAVRLGAVDRQLALDAMPELIMSY